MTDDLLRVLAQARPDELDAPVDPATRDAELARAMRGGPAPRRRRFRPAWGLAAAATAVVATAAFVALPDDPGPPPTATPSVPARLDARTVLLAAANTLTRRDAKPNHLAYWHTSMIQRTAFRVDGGYTFVQDQREDVWTPFDVHRRIVTETTILGARPATPEDERAWRRAGSPATVRFQTGTRKLKGGMLSTAPKPPQRSSSPLTDGDKVFWLGRNVSVADLLALPGDPAKLRASLLRWYDGHGTESSSTKMASDTWLFTVATSLVNGVMPVTPQVRAAAYRMLSALPSVRSLGAVRDPAGRSGVAIAFDERTPNGVLEHRLVIDAKTGNALAEVLVIRKPGGVNAVLPAGTTLSATTVLTSAWTDASPR
ncbi:hypothetical protein BTM25_09280 [Actinomadura rubteroloni]|uniref:CU044_5270 family protein n=1 Tax=Actinomadura rubteroloni TaxID=1926885 RepID=A0A2P4UNA6_9ACTN|nr:CU044_5270 family protein [Actinomadura rubteroloni]POM26527.1 hypothetical protein BTM25_09280 [Actinomadura rubteroloni]